MIIMGSLQINNTFNRLNSYVNEVFAELSLGGEWSASADLPMFLQSRYTYAESALLGENCLLMLDSEEGEKATTIKKHTNAVAKHFTGHIIYVVENITSFNRKRLIAQCIAFIVPGKQLYLPFFALDLRESFTSKQSAKDKPLSAIAQVLVLMQLYRKSVIGGAAQALAETLGVSKMTVSRAYQELTRYGLARNINKGRQKILQFELDHQELWQEAKSLLASPVKKKVWIARAGLDLPAKEAGETALSHYGMMMRPVNRVVAVNYNEWAGLKRLMQLEEQPYPDDDSVLVELWRYDPAVITEDDYVDPLSLYLSLDSEHDDRIDIAKDALLEQVWDKA